MKVIAIYDNGGESFDRYTVYFDSVERIVIKTKLYTCLGMSEHPFDPQGFGQHSSGTLGKHNGKRITFNQLPPDCQKLVKQELSE
jgi:hypothetical protein